MTKKFFTKYLPVDGEINIGDSYLMEDGHVYTATDSDDFNILNNINTYEKVKLSLCSMDIQVGDTVYIWASRTSGETFDRTGKSGIVSYVQKENGHINIDLEENGEIIHACEYDTGVVKVIGEISPDALKYVKEGEEFDENMVRGLNATDNNIIFEEDFHFKTEWIDFIQVKGPCGHFH